MKKILILIFFSFISLVLSAANKTSKASGNWSDPSIWTPAGVPAAGDVVTITNGNTVTLDITASIGSLNVYNNATFIINQPLTITQGDLLFNNGNFTKTITVINNSTLTILKGGVEMHQDALFYFKNNCTLIADKVVGKGLVLTATNGNTFDNNGYIKIDKITLSGANVQGNHNTGYIVTNSFQPSGTNVSFINSGTSLINKDVMFSGSYTIHGSSGAGTYGQFFFSPTATVGRSGASVGVAGEYLDFCRTNGSTNVWNTQSGGTDKTTKCFNKCASYPLTAMVDNGCYSDTFPGIKDICIGSKTTLNAHLPVAASPINSGLTENDFCWFDKPTGGTVLKSSSFTFETGTITKDTAFYFGRCCGIQGFTRIKIPVLVKSCQLTVIPSASPSAICEKSKDSVTLSAYSVSGRPPYWKYEWYEQTGGTFTLFKSGLDSVIKVLPTTTTTYRVISYDNGVFPEKNHDTDSVVIAVYPLPIVTFNKQDSICINAPSLKLTGGIGSPSLKGFGWYSGNGVSSTDSLTFNPRIAGENTNNKIYYMFIDSNKCKNLDSGNIIVNALPTVHLPLLPAQCIYNPPIILNQGTPANGKYYGDGISIDSVTFNPQSLTIGEHQIIYKYTETKTHCTNTDTNKIIVNPKPILNLPDTVSMCEKHPTSLTAGNETNVVYRWNLTKTGSIISLSPTKDSLVQVLALNSLSNCINVDSTFIKVNPLPKIDITAQPTVSGCQPLTINFSASPTLAKSYFWNFGDPKSNSNNISINETPSPHIYRDTGMYTIYLTVTTSFNCSDSIRKNNMITVYPKPKADFIFSPELPSSFNPEASFKDISTGGVNQWEWDFGDPDSPENSSELKNPTHFYSNYGDYKPTLIVSNQHCKDTVVFPLHVKADFTFYSPNAFTPNDDGINDLFSPKGLGINTDSYELRIYTRWGEEIFKSKDLVLGWDGTFSAKACPEGVYSWIVQFKDIEGKSHQYIGLVTLLR